MACVAAALAATAWTAMGAGVGGATAPWATSAFSSTITMDPIWT